MIVLRTIRSPGESGAGVGAFVPQLARLVAPILVLCSIGMLSFAAAAVGTSAEGWRGLAPPPGVSPARSTSRVVQTRHDG